MLQSPLLLQLRWLPKTLPPNVRLVVSTLPEPQYVCFPRLKAAISHASCFVEVPSLDINTDLPAIIEASLAMCGRTVTAEQKQLVSICSIMAG